MRLSHSGIVFWFAMVALLPASGRAEPPKAPRRLIAMAPSGAYRLECDQGELWVAPGTGEAGRKRLPVPGKRPIAAEFPARNEEEAPACEPAFISPNDRWIYAEGDDAELPPRLYRRSEEEGPATSVPSFRLVDGFVEKAKKLFLSEAKSQKLQIVRISFTFAAWSPDSARLLLAMDFFAKAAPSEGPETYASKWLCYYNTSAGAFELTDRLRVANKGKLNLTLRPGKSSPEVAVLSAEESGKEGPEEPAKDRFAKADAELNKVYSALLKQLAPDGKVQLRDEERAWLREREIAAAIHSGQSWSPFPEASHLEGLAVATEARVSDLRKRMSAEQK